MLHVIKASQFVDRSIQTALFQKAAQLEQQDKAGTLQAPLKGKVLASVFYEASTRTRFSFESAMLKLGGTVIGTESASHFSSVTKGESLPDTITIIGGYADVIVLRHPETGSAALAASVSSVPVINAGDGTGEHPTQALLDLYTIQKECGRLDHLTVAVVGDLKYGRTVHSLLLLLAHHEDITVFLVSPPELQLPRSLIELFQDKKVFFTETTDLQGVLGQADVLYVTRIQKERFTDLAEYDRVKEAYILTPALVQQMKNDAIIMHPLPRVIEISPEVDADKRAAYFRQARNGLYIRMALLEHIFSK